jgi:hypothetical protein
MLRFFELCKEIGFGFLRADDALSPTSTAKALSVECVVSILPRNSAILCTLVADSESLQPDIQA